MGKNRRSLLWIAAGALMGMAAANLPASEIRSFPSGALNPPQLAEDISAEVLVYFRAIRFNEATEQWNVDVVVTNQGGRDFASPLFLTIEGFTNTFGPLAVDGVSTNAPATPFLRIDTYGVLSPGKGSSPRTLALGFVEGAGAPRMQTRVFGVPSGRTHALGLTRSLDGAGQPLTGVRVTETGPQGRTATGRPRRSTIRPRGGARSRS
ncbi:MAG: hypothetical protein HC814_07325 [Rhodobacteraceae bacterium]|nr:hypothetical protein [Paracoccaceae bacterium]